MTHPTPETLKALSELLAEHGLGVDPSGRFGPPPAPVLLPDHVRAWLGTLNEDDLSRLRRLIREFDEDDVATVKRAMKLADDSATVGKFLKWLAITFVALFTGAVAFGEKIAVVWKWILGAPR